MDGSKNLAKTFFTICDTDGTFWLTKLEQFFDEEHAPEINQEHCYDKERFLIREC